MLSRRARRVSDAVLVGLVVLAGVGATARAQTVPIQPRVPDTAQRSGLVSRFAMVPPMLPHDKDRDVFFGTRWADRPKIIHPNFLCSGGLYGLPWRGDCTECFAPNFRGSPGVSTVGHRCNPPHPLLRLPVSVFHPFRPVSYYYAGGCYVPIYDLDPFVTGPGPYPWPFLKKEHNGG